MQVGTYCTQIGPDGSGHERCGAACLASVMLNEGWQSDPFMLTCQVADENGITDVGCTSDQLLAAAARYGFTGGKWHQMAEAWDLLANGHAVLVLCNNVYLAPRMYPPGAGWNAMHWIRILAPLENGQMVYSYDPLTYDHHPSGYTYQNPNAYLTYSVQRAVQVTAYPEAGIFLTSPSGKNLNG